MKVGYYVILRADDTEKEQTLYGGHQNITLEGIETLNLRLNRTEQFPQAELQLQFKLSGCNLKLGEALQLADGQKTFSSLLPIHVPLFDSQTGLSRGTLDAELCFDRRTPEYACGVELPFTGPVTIGGKGCQIQLNDPMIGGDQLTLTRRGIECRIEVRQARYGATLNGQPLTGSAWIRNIGFFTLDGFSFFYRRGYLYLDAHSSLSYPTHWKTIQNGYSSSHLDYPKFNRSPRYVREPDTTPIEILDPSPKPEIPKSNLMLQIMPTAVMLVLTVALRGSMGGGMGYVLFSACSMSLGVFTSIISAQKSKKDAKAQIAARESEYRDYLNKKEEEIAAARQEELQCLREIYRPPLQDLDAIRDFSDRLFDRSPGDPDFLHLYLGQGNQKPLRPVNYNRRESITLGDELMQAPEHLSARWEMLADAPVITDCCRSNAVGIVGQSHRLYGMMKNLTIDLCTRHYYGDVNLFYILNSNSSSGSEWLRWLPHVQNRDLGVRNIVCTDSSKSALFEYLYSLLASRERQSADGPHVVILVMMDSDIKNHPVSKYLDRCAELGVTFLFFEQYRELLPDCCNEIIQLDDNILQGTLTRKRDCDRSWTFQYTLIDDQTVQKAALRLAPIFCEEITLEGSLPRSYSFYDCFGLTQAADLSLETAWRRNDVTKTLRAPIGINAKGETVWLDIHEKAHGPHGLVAGTTGSGKSEFLQSYLMALAASYSPLDVAFLIIDFKGGGMANQLKKLPHMVGAITNIDGREIARSLKSIKAELKKRQEVFDQYQVNHIDKYIKLYKAGKAGPSLPHLIIVVDEFAELKANQPDFMDELISAARIGRSLGIHLILATQKPAGQVSDQIWSNSRFRVCLKVQNKEDSVEMLKSPLAAEIREPGRGYLQVGSNEIFELFQSAYSGGEESNRTVAQTEEFTLSEVSLWGERTTLYDSAKKAREQEKEKEQKTEKRTQLMAVIEETVSYCQAQTIPGARPICLEPLPVLLDFTPGSKSSLGISVTLGRYDDPENQRQGHVCFNLTNGNLMIIGAARSGKTGALQTIIRSLAETYTPEQVQIYILDFASMILKNFESLAHVGGVVVASEEEKVKNLLKLLFTELEHRKEKLLQAGVSSYSAYLEAGNTDLPQLVLILDNFTIFQEIYEEETDLLLRLSREGLSAGISVVAANAHLSGVSYRHLANYAYRMAFYCYDSGEYDTLFDYCRMSVVQKPGRGLVRLDNKVLEFQAALAFPGAREVDQMQAVHSWIDVQNQSCRTRAKQIPMVPELLPWSTLRQEQPALFETVHQIPVGINYETMEMEYIDLLQLGAFGICGREGMGRTNLLAAILKTVELQGNTAVYVIDDLQKRLAFAKDLSCVRGYSLDTETVSKMLEGFHEELLRRRQQCKQEHLDLTEAITSMPLLLGVLSGQEVLRTIAEDMTAQDQLMEMVKDLRSYGVCILVTGIENVSLSYDDCELLKYLRDEKKLFMFEDLPRFRLLSTSLQEDKTFTKELRRGDAYGYHNQKMRKIRTIFADH